MDFDHCVFDAPLYSAVDTTSPRTYHWNNIFGTGSISYIDFTGCLFKASNRFQIEMWDSSVRRAQQINFYGCDFEVSESGHIDYALDGAHHCTVDSCRFASNGNGLHPAYPSDICLEESAGVPLHDFTITNNYHVRGLFTNILMGHAAYNCYVDGNTLRNDLGTVGKHDTSGGMIRANHGDGPSNYITVTNNTITCDGTPTAPDRWGAAIDVSGNYAVVTGNTVIDYNKRPGASYTGPDVLVVGSSNTVGTLVESRVNATDNVCTDGVGF
jgi:hypothetical protein